MPIYICEECFYKIRPRAGDPRPTRCPVCGSNLITLRQFRERVSL